jgi:hypothetical protein
MLTDTMQLSKMDKEQLVELCNALYELLQARQPQALEGLPKKPPTIAVPYNTPYPYNPIPNNAYQTTQTTCQNQCLNNEAGNAKDLPF